MDAQRVAADEAANRVAAQVEVLHQASMHEVQSQVRDVIAEAGSTVEQLREQLRMSEIRCGELFEYGQFVERQLTESKADLSRVEAELQALNLSYQELQASLHECQGNNNSLTFQLNQTRVENQIKDREIQRLRSAAPSPSASSSGSPPKPPKPAVPHAASVPAPSEASWIHLESSDPPSGRNIYSSLFAPSSASPPPQPNQHLPRQTLVWISSSRWCSSWFTMSTKMLRIKQRPMKMERKMLLKSSEKDVVDQRALRHLKLEPIPPDAASFRIWKTGFKVQLSKLDTSGRGIVLAWISRGFDADRADLEASEIFVNRLPLLIVENGLTCGIRFRI